MRRTKAAVAVAAAVLIVAGLMGGGVSSAAINGFEVTRVTSLPGFEPGVHVLPSGRVVVDAPPGLGGHSRGAYSDSLTAGTCTYASNNCFANSTFPNPYSRFPGGGDSEIAVGHGNRVYFADLWVGSNSFYRSTDGGATYNAGTPISDVPASDRQWLAVGPEVGGKDTVYMIYQQFGLGWPMFVRSDDSGDTWLQQKRLAITSSGPTGRMIADDTGWVGYDFVNSNGYVGIGFSADKGTNWTQKQVSVTGWGGTTPDLALEGSTVYATWIDRFDFNTRFGRSIDKGFTWESMPFNTVVGAVGSSVYSTIAARGDKVAIAWYQNFNVDGTINTTPIQPDNVAATGHWKIMYAESLDRGVTWSSPVAISNRVKLGKVCTAGLDCDADRDLGDFMTIAIDTNNKSVVAGGSFLDAPTGLVILRQV